MTQIKIAFFDVDGTLAGHNPGDNTSILDRVSNSTIKSIQKLQDKGITPVIATGRNRGMIKELMDALGINNLIANNGRFVEVDGKVIVQDSFKKSDVEKIVEKLRKKQIEFCFETADVLYKNKSSRFVADSSMNIIELADGLIPENVLQIIFRTTSNEERLDLKISTIQAVKVAPKVYDITKENSNKAVGVQQFLDAKKIPSNLGIAFGDEENDLEMFQKVGYSVAMGNATQQVKNSAD